MRIDDLQRRTLIQSLATIFNPEPSKSIRLDPQNLKVHQSHSLNSLKGDYIGDYIRDYCRIAGDTRSLDYSSQERQKRLIDFGNALPLPESGKGIAEP